MTLEEALNNNDMDIIIDSMTAYVYSRMKTIGAKNLEGMQPEDFVGEVLLKVVEGERDWLKAKCSFREFLFGCLRSHLNNFFKSFEPIFEDEMPNVGVRDMNNSNELKDIAILMLIDDGADEDEIAVFECWVDNIYKPASISKQIAKDVKGVYNIIKRLERKIPNLKFQIMNFV
jgi:DNA-directed RNA polymerase specialized sigma24 family protein